MAWGLGGEKHRTCKILPNQPIWRIAVASVGLLVVWHGVSPVALTALALGQLSA
jgi:hypothetical protein